MSLLLKSIIVSSHVLGAYASFLWDITDDESEDEMNTQSDKTKVSSVRSASTSIYV